MNQLILIAAAILIVVGMAIVTTGIVTPQSNTTETNSCNTDFDCACGKSISTGACAYGNSAYINASEQCPDFCTGIAGNLEIKCANKTCVQKQTDAF